LTVLAWWEITFFNRALVCETLFALKEKLLAFTAALTALRIKISSQGILLLYQARLDAALLWWTATVVRHWRHIRNTGDFKTGSIQSTHGGFAARARALDTNFKVLYAAFLSSLASRFGSHLRREWSTLA
jgi:hypothetical protein